MTNNNNIYTLDFFTDTKIFTPIYNISPAAIILCAVIYALSVSLSYSYTALIFAAVLPLILLFRNKYLTSQLLKLNAINLVMIITIALTWPEFRSGLMMGILISFRINMIYIVFASLILSMGHAKIYQALSVLNIPEKLRVLFILTLRGIFTMHEKFNAALISAGLRAPGLRGIMKFKTFAYITASVLIQSSDRSEKFMRAIQCRGGFQGFSQSFNEGINKQDYIYFFCFTIYSMAIIFLNYA